MGREQISQEEISHSDSIVNDDNFPDTPEPVRNTTPDPETERKDDIAEKVQSPPISRQLQPSQNVTEGKDSNDRVSTLTERKSATTTKKNDEETDEIDVMNIPNKVDIVWRNVFLFVYLHIFSVIGLYCFFTGRVMWQTFFWTGLMHMFGALGITAGAHRYWSHKSYKAKLPLKLLLVYMQTVAFQNSIHEWTRDHRVHHKYSETNADPHNAKRGFFFAHMGWLCSKKHPAVKVKGKQIDMSDLEADPVIMFQKKYYTPLVLTISFIIPALVPWYFWGQDFFTAWSFAAQLRYCFNLHCTWLVNSAAHLWGDKPYDQNINPSENKGVAIFAFGEGWHNYHHVFPWDYKTAELGRYRYNFTTAFIDFFAWIGQAYDLKTVSDKMVRDRVRRTGDGSWRNQPELSVDEAAASLASSMGLSHSGPWGWGDKDIPLADAQVTQTLYPLISLHDD